MNYGIYVSSATEPTNGYNTQGLLISENAMLGCNYGLYAESGAYISIFNNAIDYCGYQGVVSNAGLSVISGNYIALDPATGHNSNAIGINSQSLTAIYGNVINQYSPYTGGNGIAVAGLQHASITGNITFHYQNGLYLDSTSVALAVVGNANVAATSSPIVNASSGSQIVGNVT